MIVDFHCHSTASDGTFAPAELAAKGAGFVALALTDHDNCDGVREFLEAEKARDGRDAHRPSEKARDGRDAHRPSEKARDGRDAHRPSGEARDGRDAHRPSGEARDGRDARRPRLIAGIELSIEPGEGFDKFHLLGLGVDPNDRGLKDFLRRVLEGRNGRNDRIIANFRRLGIEMKNVRTIEQSNNPNNRTISQSNNPNNPNNRTIEQSNIFSYAHGEVLARPHFARWLMEHGHAATIKEAFERYLLPDSPAATRCYEERWHPSQEDAFRVIHAAGGLCVMAHPKYWRADWKTTGCDFAAAERGLVALKEKGLDGVEALYQANTGEENVNFVRIATKLGYLKSAGSDFHGAHKPTIPLGMEVSENYIAPLLERLC